MMDQMIAILHSKETQGIVMTRLQADGLLTESIRDFLGSLRDRVEQRWEKVGIELIRGDCDCPHWQDCCTTMS